MLSGGESFAETLKRHPTIIDPAYIARVPAGEAVGKLDAVLNALGANHSRHDPLAGRLNSAMATLFFFLVFAVLAASIAKIPLVAAPMHDCIIGPATIIGVSLIVGTLIVSIMSALLSITELAL